VNRKYPPFQPGDTAGHLTLLYRGFRQFARQRKTIWLCRCRCLTVKEIAESNLRNRDTFSCGCLWLDYAARLNRTHGQTHTPEFQVWLGIRSRCLNPKNKRYADYAGRGITIYPPWIDDFPAFYAAVGARPSPQHSLDRYPDNDGNYEPGNVRWATRQEQQRNRRNNVRLSYQGEVLTLAEWSERLGIPRGCLLFRLKQAGSLEEALKIPVLHRNRCQQAREEAL
jgi:hypothetical protein